MFVVQFFYLLHLTKAINTKKFVIGEWEIYDKANTTSLYTIEFHLNENNLNGANKEGTIIGSIWSNKIDDLDNDDLDNFDPDNFVICTFELAFSAPSEGKIEISNLKKENNLLRHNLQFFINETENKNVIITFNSDLLKLTCTFINSINGIIKYQLLNNDNEGEVLMNIVKNPKISFFPWTKFFIYSFYAIFILIFCRTILVTRSFLIQKNRENAKIANKNREKEEKKENSQQNTEKEKEEEEKQPKEIKDHQKTE